MPGHQLTKYHAASTMCACFPLVWACALPSARVLLNVRRQHALPADIKGPPQHFLTTARNVLQVVDNTALNMRTWPYSPVCGRKTTIWHKKIDRLCFLVVFRGLLYMSLPWCQRPMQQPIDASRWEIVHYHKLLPCESLHITPSDFIRSASHQSVTAPLSLSDTFVRCQPWRVP